MSLTLAHRSTPWTSLPLSRRPLGPGSGLCRARARSSSSLSLTDTVVTRESIRRCRFTASTTSVPIAFVLMTLFSMSDPGTTYRTREEIQQVRSERDVIAGLKKNILEWNVTDEDSLKVGPEPESVATSSEHADRVYRPSTRPPRRRSTPRSPRPSRAPCPTSRSSGPTST